MAFPATPKAAPGGFGVSQLPAPPSAPKPNPFGVPSAGSGAKPFGAPASGGSGGFSGFGAPSLGQPAQGSAGAAGSAGTAGTAFGAGLGSSLGAGFGAKPASTTFGQPAAPNFATATVGFGGQTPSRSAQKPAEPQSVFGFDALRAASGSLRGASLSGALSSSAASSLMTANATQECLAKLGVCATVLAYRRLYTDPAGSPFKFVFYNLKGSSTQAGGQAPAAGTGFGTAFGPTSLGSSSFGSGNRFSSFGTGGSTSAWGLPNRNAGATGQAAAGSNPADSALLKQAEADNPNPEKYAPVVATGFQDLEARAKLHAKELQTANTAMAESFEAKLSDLEREQAWIADRIQKCKAIESTFQHRILKLCAAFHRPSEAVGRELALLEKRILGQFRDSVLSRLNAVSDVLEMRASSGGATTAASRLPGGSEPKGLMGASLAFAGSRGVSEALLGSAAVGEPCELTSLDPETRKQIRDHLALQGQRLVELCEFMRRAQ